MAAGSQTGRAGYATVNNVAIPITKWTAKGTKELAKSTDSSNFDVASGQLYSAYKPGEIGLEGTIEGNWDPATTGSGIIAALKSDAPIPILLQYDRSTNAYQGNFNLSDVETTVEIPGSTMISFTANYKCDGIFTTF